MFYCLKHVSVLGVVFCNKEKHTGVLKCKIVYIINKRIHVFLYWQSVQPDSSSPRHVSNYNS